MTLLWTNAILLLCITVFAGTGTGLPCAVKDVGGESHVCVCNATYCDTVTPEVPRPRLVYTNYRSTKDGERLSPSYANFSTSPKSKIIVTLNGNETLQPILGFGGAFTDAAGINILSLSSKSQLNLLKSYYSKDGIEYNVGRIPMASCDFSTRPYSYDDIPGDLNLTKFSLTSEDFKLKIPLILAAQKIKGSNLTLFGSPWSAPAWMKTNNNMTGKGTLKGTPGGPYFKAWANYFVRFLQEYEKNGISMWGVTAQNEPQDGNLNNFPFQAMGWTSELQRDFIAMDLGPALEKYGYEKIKLMILDDARFLLPFWADDVFKSEAAKKYVSGIAVHWYEDFLTPETFLSSTHELFPDKFLLSTEACAGSMPWETKKVDLGSWTRAESYAHDIIQDLKNWVTGWIDWNIALDMQGGPNWVKNFVDSPIIVDAKSDSFYKQPMYYALGHFSKFLVPGSKRIAITGVPNNSEVTMVSFVRPDGTHIFILLNRSDDDGVISVRDPALGYINLFYPSRSIQTLLWRH